MGGVSSPPSPRAAWSVKSRAEHGNGSAKQVFGTEKWLANPCDGRITAKKDRKNSIDTMNTRQMENPA